MAAISPENGLEGLILTQQHVNSEIYCQLFPQIHSHGENFILFGDQVSYHHGKYTTKEMKMFGTKLIQNLAYTPDLNPIERFFQAVKAYYKHLKLEATI